MILFFCMGFCRRHTVDRSKTVKTPLGEFSFHHCDPKFFMGFEYFKPFLKIATPAARVLTKTSSDRIIANYVD